jgi:RNA recognition motif-containing protein
MIGRGTRRGAMSIFSSRGGRGGATRGGSSNNGERKPTEQKESVAVNNDTYTAVWVGNLSYTTTAEQFKTLVGSYGNVESVDVPVGKTNRPKGYAVAKFSSHDAAVKALEGLNNKEVEGRTLQTRPDKFTQ